MKPSKVTSFKSIPTPATPSRNTVVFVYSVKVSIVSVPALMNTFGSLMLNAFNVNSVS